MGDVTVTSAGSESRIEAKLDALLVTTTRIETEITSRGKQIDDHESRIRELERAESVASLEKRVAVVETDVATAGRFTWGDVGKVIGALAAGGGLLAMFVGLVIALQPGG